MKKLSVAVLALCVGALGAPVLILGRSQQTTQNDTKPRPMDIKGPVRSDNGKITLIADEG
jgi:hypothetical protein